MNGPRRKAGSNWQAESGLGEICHAEDAVDVVESSPGGARGGVELKEAESGWQTDRGHGELEYAQGGLSEFNPVPKDDSCETSPEDGWQADRGHGELDYAQGGLNETSPAEKDDSSGPRKAEGNWQADRDLSEFQNETGIISENSLVGVGTRERENDGSGWQMECGLAEIRSAGDCLSEVKETRNDQRESRDELRTEKKTVDDAYNVDNSAGNNPHIHASVAYGDEALTSSAPVKDTHVHSNSDNKDTLNDDLYQHIDTNTQKVSQPNSGDMVKAFDTSKADYEDTADDIGTSFDTSKDVHEGIEDDMVKAFETSKDVHEGTGDDIVKAFDTNNGVHEGIEDDGYDTMNKVNIRL